MDKNLSLTIDPAALPEDVSVLRTLIVQLIEELRKRDGRIDDLQQRMDLLLRRLYGRTSEKLDPAQLLLFLLQEDGESSEQPPLPEPPPELPPASVAAAPAAAAPKKPGHGRRRLPDTLKRVEVIHDLTPAEKESLGGEANLKLIGREVTEQLEWEPSSLFVIQHVQLTYARLDAGAAGETPSAASDASAPTPEAAATADAVALPPASIITASKPPQPIPGGLPGPGLIAHAATAKYVDHAPLNRQERQFARHGLSISRQTLCGWVLAGADLLMSLSTLACGIVIRSGVVHLDATTVKIRDAHEKLKRTGYFWPCVGDDLHPLIAFHYTPTHCREGPAAILRDFQGFLQVDAHNVYDDLFVGGRIVEVDCWMHARRKFFDARTVDRLRAETALAHIGRLYAVEREIATNLAGEWRELPREERFANIAAARQERARPVLDQYFNWLEAESPGLMPKNPVRQAMDYSLRQRAGLLRYCDDGSLAIDNGAAERAIRGIALGRKNWLFCGSERGARAACVYFTLAASCQRHGHDPFAYLRDMFRRLPILTAECGGEPPEDVLRPLLPDQWKPGPSGTASS